METFKKLLLLLLLLIPGIDSKAQITETYVAHGWAKNSVNAVILRHNSLTTFKGHQYIAFYNNSQQLILAKRKTGSKKWQFHNTGHQANTNDAHCSISLIVDGDGYLHVSWDHHGNQLNYCKGLKPESLELSAKLSMTGVKEARVTYPEFYNINGGNLLFLYRTGESGNGDLMMNRYDIKTKQWQTLQNAFINGEGQRNAYWQCTVDRSGTIHLSWVWRETGGVETNHDICYARSKDGGKTWEKSTGEKYNLPITAANAEYAVKIPQNSELINTTSMAADTQGRPYIATYWRAANSQIPQFYVVYNNGKGWQTQQVGQRVTPFTLSGSGTKRIPISRPVILLQNQKTIVVYRDEEQQSKVCAAVCNDLNKGKWTLKKLTAKSVGMWEPSYDTELWKQKNIINLYVQNVEQGDGERIKEIPPSPITVLQWKP